jgi:hypothetical protein
MFRTFLPVDLSCRNLRHSTPVRTACPTVSPHHFTADAAGSRTNNLHEVGIIHYILPPYRTSVRSTVLYSVLYLHTWYRATALTGKQLTSGSNLPYLRSSASSILNFPLLDFYTSIRPLVQNPPNHPIHPNAPDASPIPLDPVRVLASSSNQHKGSGQRIASGSPADRQPTTHGKDGGLGRWKRKQSNAKPCNADATPVK